MTDFKKTTQSEEICYGVVYNPKDHTVKICYRGVDDVTINPEDFTDKQKQAVEVFGARFLATDRDDTEEDIVKDIDAGIVEKQEAAVEKETK